MAKVTTVYMMIKGEMQPFSMKEYLAMRAGDARIRGLKFIAIDGRMYEATPEQFKAWKKERNRYTYINSDCPEYAIVSFDAIDDDGNSGDAVIADETTDVADEAIARCMRAALYSALDKLLPAERQLIYALYFEQQTEREYAQFAGLASMTVHNRKVRILTKIKKLLNSKN